MLYFEANILRFMFFDLDFPFEMKQDEFGKTWIYDIIRKKFVFFTPEEEIRQKILWYLVFEKKYPKSLIAVERQIRYNKLSKRFDILIFGKSGSPKMLIECKAPNVRLTEESLRQLARYQSTLNAQYLILSNGSQSIFLEYSDGKLSKIEDFPSFSEF